MGPLHAVSEYAIQWIKKMQNENLRSWVPRQQVTDQFNEHVQVDTTKMGFDEVMSLSMLTTTGMDQAHRLEGLLSQLVQE